MKVVYASWGFVLGATAALIPRDQCCFSLTASGGKSGAVGQLADGQLRVGQTGGLATQSSTFCLANGGLTDSSGRGCILTPPTTQFQCDAGASPTTGFSVNSNGILTYSGSTQFYACATGDNGGYNVYTTTTPGAQTGCVAITLNTGGKCSSGGSSSSAPASSAPASSAPASSIPVTSAPATQPASPVASSTTYACNPAHSYPNGAQCVSNSGGLTLVTPAPSTSSTYACNPAHSYPNGAQCVSSSGGLTLVTPAPSSSSAYACNPAHSYPNGAQCVSTGGSLTLVTPTTSSSSTYACNPAHSYPNGAQCVSTSGGLTLVTPAPSSSATYACNPAHSYPNGQSCISTGGSLTLVYSSTSAPAQPQTHTVYSTTYQTITSCAQSVNHCPPQSTVTYSSSFPVVMTSSMPASSAPASSAPSQPASTSPSQAASTVPASSAPASSAPASSVPASSAPASSAPASSVPASSAPSTSTGGGACPTTLSPGAYQTPHAIIPVNKDQPSTSYGTQYNCYVSSSNSTVFNFDIPPGYSGKQCSLVFLFPQQSMLQTSSYTQSGSGGLTFDLLSSVCPVDASYSSVPSTKTTLTSISSVSPGNSYYIWSGSCPVGSQSYKVSSTGGYSLTFFEDWNPSPIGVFVTVC